MKPKLKYFLTSFIGAAVIFFAGMYIVDHFEVNFNSFRIGFDKFDYNVYVRVDFFNG